jgi:hypothetical protein
MPRANANSADSTMTATMAMSNPFIRALSGWNGAARRGRRHCEVAMIPLYPSPFSATRAASASGRVP